jgi:D-serine deaminase-like pyridoxal phosphate-dependent protein
MESISSDDYAVPGIEDIPTPALLIYLDRVDANIRAVIARCDGDPARWRPHVKTAKIADVMARFLTHGITHFKCATTRELRVLLDLGAPDVLLAFPVVGATARRVRQMAAENQRTRISVLVESAEHFAPFAGSGIGVFIDCNPGMDRTGSDPANTDAIAALARTVRAAQCEFRGLHWYDGHLHGLDMNERTTVAHRGYDAFASLVSRLRAAGVSVDEVIVAGTPAAPCALSYPRWSAIARSVQISPGTVVYNDTSSLAQLPPAWGLTPAALVLTNVVSHPRAGRFTCDAGHKAVSADAGVPTCAVVGHGSWTPAKPSEEHLPVDCESVEEVPPIGTPLLLLPRHVCPTVNNFDEAILIRDGRIAGTMVVSARGHDGL